MINFLLFTLIHFLVNFVLKRKNLLIDQKMSSAHKNKIKTNISTPLASGLVFIICFIFILQGQNYILFLGLVLLYLIGLLSDINFIPSPFKRIIFQTISILFFVIVYDLTIKTTSIELLDKLLIFRTFNVLFLSICLLVLINGFNFLDGINTLVIGNFTICLLAIFYISKKHQLYLDFYLVESVIIILLSTFLYNFFGKSFLGDSGTYCISFLIGVICIKFAYENYTTVSPYFIVSILWYPAIENLFSILRRVFFKKKLSQADNEHLHHLIYSYIDGKKFLKKGVPLNTLTGMVINSYIFSGTFLSTVNYNSTIVLSWIIVFNISIYLSVYVYFYKLIIKK